MSDNKDNGVVQPRSWVGRYFYPRPREEQLDVRKVSVDATCSECGGTNIKRYPSATHVGPRMITRCQDCFHVLARERPTEADTWPPFRSTTFDWDASMAERASRDRLSSS
jgi:predicted RNA-binding Zn-ribbon protein involved in translation (DUF1610 family)